MTGLPNNTVVIITTCGQGNRTDPAQNVTLRSFVGKVGLVINVASD